MLPEQKDFIESCRQQIRAILEGKDSRKLIIMGPCSIHDLKSAREYAIKLKNLSQELEDEFFIVMRTYFEKPRTALGWKGFLYDPDLNGSNNINSGLTLARTFLIELAQQRIPAAAELLDPFGASYLEDLLSWGCIGARTTTSQTHRQMTSALTLPIGFKNTTEGSIEAAINGILSCAQEHTYMGVNPDGRISAIKTRGNSGGHLVLRGCEIKPNYDPASVNKAQELLKKYNLKGELLVDCSHDNSRRNHENQPEVFKSLIQQILLDNESIVGFLLESHLHAGKQTLKSLIPLQYAVSVTDSCMDWPTTENLIRWGYEQLKSRSKHPSRENDKLVLSKTS
jgi:3-deoxy-7-phosphoheptulonate synthase